MGEEGKGSWCFTQTELASQVQNMWVGSLAREEPVEKEMATHCSVLAWTIPWTEEPGGLQSAGSQRVGHD